MRVFFLQGLKDYSANPFQIHQHIVVPESNDPITLSFQPISAPRVTLSAMLSPIDFHDKPSFGAAEIGDERSQAPLPPEFPAIETTSPKRKPQGAFGIRHVPPERRSVSADLSANGRHRGFDNKKKTLIPAFSRRGEKE